MNLPTGYTEDQTDHESLDQAERDYFDLVDSQVSEADVN